MSYYPAPGGYPPGYPSAHPSNYSAANPGEPQHLNAPVPLNSYGEPEGPYGVEAWFNFRNSGYLKGFVVGAGVALILTNPTVQKAVVAGAVKIWSAVQGGVEEVKEQIQDIKAEMSQKE
jgi:hypothetical protein